MTPPQRRAASDALDKLFAWVKARNYAGIDPYDALNSPFANVLSLRSRLGRIALTQTLRRSPINFRPLLGIKSGVNPKGQALFLEGSIKLGRFHDVPIFLERLEKTLASASGSAWGYNFPWQNRFQLLPSSTPTIVNSAFVGHALLDLYAATGSQRALDLAESIPDFILKDLHRLRDADDAFCFSYTPADENYVHNANMLGASLLARFAKEFGRTELFDPAMCALNYSMRRQHDDGSWYYAERREQRWIDSFHTGFNLEALRRFLRLGCAYEYADAYAKGTDFYANSFFLADGTPKYYADRFYLVDIHSPAEAIYFFSGEGVRRRELVEKILFWMLNNMRDRRRGYFYFRKSRYFTIKIPYMRWSQAWTFRALAEYLTVAQETA